MLTAKQIARVLKIEESIGNMRLKMLLAICSCCRREKYMDDNTRVCSSCREKDRPAEQASDGGIIGAVVDLFTIDAFSSSSSSDSSPSTDTSDFSGGGGDSGGGGASGDW